MFIGTSLHPTEADPNEPIEAFTEYAADQLWIFSHLSQFVGMALVMAALLLLFYQMEHAGGWSRIAKGGAIASLTLTAVLQAVDGFALKAIVDTWAAAPTPQKEAIFYAAYAVRQIEIGLVRFSSLVFGLTVTLGGIALLSDRTYPK